MSAWEVAISNAITQGQQTGRKHVALSYTWRGSTVWYVVPSGSAIHKARRRRRL